MGWIKAMDLQPFPVDLSTQPQWVQPKTFERRYRLMVDDQEVAALDFQSAFGSLAAAATSTDRWTFKRVGFFNPRVTVRREGSEADLAVYRPRWTGSEGRLEFADGRVLLWKTANFWATEYVFTMPEGDPLLLFRQGLEDGKLNDFFKAQARVVFQPESGLLTDLPLLVLLGWYLMILAQEDSGAAAASAAAAR
jgi:hypothetical protein